MQWDWTEQRLHNKSRKREKRTFRCVWAGQDPVGWEIQVLGIVERFSSARTAGRDEEIRNDPHLALEKQVIRVLQPGVHFERDDQPDGKEVPVADAQREGTVHLEDSRLRRKAQKAWKGTKAFPGQVCPRESRQARQLALKWKKNDWTSRKWEEAPGRNRFPQNGKGVQGNGRLKGVRKGKGNMEIKSRKLRRKNSRSR